MAFPERSRPDRFSVPHVFSERTGVAGLRIELLLDLRPAPVDRLGEFRRRHRLRVVERDRQPEHPHAGEQTDGRGRRLEVEVGG